MRRFSLHSTNHKSITLEKANHQDSRLKLEDIYLDLWYLGEFYLMKDQMERIVRRFEMFRCGLVADWRNWGTSSLVKIKAHQNPQKM